MARGNNKSPGYREIIGSLCSDIISHTDSFPCVGGVPKKTENARKLRFRTERRNETARPELPGAARRPRAEQTSHRKTAGRAGNARKLT